MSKIEERQRLKSVRSLELPKWGPITVQIEVQAAYPHSTRPYET